MHACSGKRHKETHRSSPPTYMTVFVDVIVGVPGLRRANEALKTTRSTPHPNSFEQCFIAAFHVLLSLKPGICNRVSLLLPPLLPLCGPFPSLFFPFIGLIQGVFVLKKPLADLQTFFFFLLLGASCTQSLPLMTGFLLLFPSFCLSKPTNTR